MMEEADEQLRRIIQAQADSIHSLERQLDASAAALDALRRECAQQRAWLRADGLDSEPTPQAPQLPHLSWPARIRKAGILIGGRLLPASAKRLVKKFWDPWAEPPMVRPRPHANAPAPRIATTNAFDIVCFSIIDWSFRWQRPQQLLSRFAEAGHRVFIFKTTKFLAPGKTTYHIEQVRDNVWEVTLAPPLVIDVYGGTIDPPTVAWFPSMLDAMRREFDIVSAVALVQVATWRDVAKEAQRRFGWTLVYDCMDEWKSFPGMKPPLLAAEERLVREADLVTVSAGRLLEKWQGHNAHVELVRNGSDFEHFSAPQTERLLAGVKRPIAGYFGAIAPWFDVALLARVAAQRPQYSFVVIGGVFDVDVRPLQQLPNVHLVGQQPYARMPAYLRDFDVCLIPFVVSDITAATDPVKFYEYISLGKPVVSTFMPELEQFGDLLYHAGDEADFLTKLDAAMREDDEDLVARRIETARANTWSARSAVMLGAIRAVDPRSASSSR